MAIATKEMAIGMKISDLTGFSYFTLSDSTARSKPKRSTNPGYRSSQRRLFLSTIRMPWSVRSLTKLPSPTKPSPWRSKRLRTMVPIIGYTRIKPTKKMAGATQTQGRTDG